MTSIHLGDLIEARFIERVNRFLCRVALDGKVVDAHLHDPGRLKELLIRDSRMLLREEHAPHRKTDYDIVGVYSSDTLVSCDTGAPNRLVNQALHERTIPGLPAYSKILPEYTYGHSRIDFCLDERILLEVKGATLVRNDQALFPDAPTERGRKHLNTLISALKNGFESYIFFLVQRPDAFSFSPNRDTDPEFADTLRHAVKKGVNILVYTSKFKGNSLYLHENISVIDL
jgi:sugar fermentation stimulation protein A